MLKQILGPDPRTTLGGILLALGLVALKASTFGFPRGVDFAGALVAAIGGGLLGRSAQDAGRTFQIAQTFHVNGDPARLEETLRKAGADAKGGPQ